MHTSQYWIRKLKLQKHPEGGYFSEIYRSGEEIKKEHLPPRYSGARNHSTSIYFLLTSDEFSTFHRIKSDETWHFYLGLTVTIHMIDEKGNYSTVKLGSNPDNGEIFQFTIPHGTWFAASVQETDSYALIGCTVSPGFHFDDFELGKRENLVKLFPEHEKVINEFSAGYSRKE
jgi:predicted cupin superfamily sugar epimerase